MKNSERRLFDQLGAANVRDDLEFDRYGPEKRRAAIAWLEEKKRDRKKHGSLCGRWLPLLRRSVARKSSRRAD